MATDFLKIIAGIAQSAGEKSRTVGWISCWEDCRAICSGEGCKVESGDAR
jgi:hypothetical protein